jgi:hypothetical protein
MMANGSGAGVVCLAGMSAGYGEEPRGRMDISAASHELKELPQPRTCLRRTEPFLVISVLCKDKTPQSDVKILRKKPVIGL